MSTAGLKFDSEKLDWTLLPARPTAEVVKVLQHGAEKYARDNWQELSDPKQRYLAALLRHAFALVDGEEIDPESGLPHAAHIGCNALFLTHFHLEDNNDN